MTGLPTWMQHPSGAGETIDKIVVYDSADPSGDVLVLEPACRCCADTGDTADWQTLCDACQQQLLTERGCWHRQGGGE